MSILLHSNKGALVRRTDFGLRYIGKLLNRLKEISNVSPNLRSRPGSEVASRTHTMILGDSKALVNTPPIVRPGSIRAKAWKRAMLSEFPYLETYLSLVQEEDAHRAAKRPEEWVKWLGVLGTIVSGAFHAWYVMVAILASSAALEVVFATNRLGARSRQDLVRRRPVRNELADKIGQRQAELLDKCAKHALDVVATVRELESVGPTIPSVYYGTRVEAREAADQAFRNALKTMSKVLIFGQQLEANDVTELESIEFVLSMLAIETEAFAESIIVGDDVETLEPIMERLRSMRESDDDLHSKSF